MEITVSGKKMLGNTEIIPSKSYLHRMLICASLCKSQTVINGIVDSEDIKATVNCIDKTLSQIKTDRNSFSVSPFSTPLADKSINCFESASTLRFILPVYAALGVSVSIDMSDRLSKRPIQPLCDLLNKNGCKIEYATPTTLILSGKLTGNVFKINGDISSQFISGLLLAAPIIGKGTQVSIDGKAVSSPYIEMTLNVQRQFGVEFDMPDRFTYICKTDGYTSPKSITATGDWSSAAPLLTAAAISKSHDYSISGLDNDFLQADRRILDIFKKSGVVSSYDNGKIKIINSEIIKPFSVDISDCPDLIFSLAVFASAADGESRILGVERLRYKESDRINATVEMINALGGHAEYFNDSIVINGTGKLSGGIVDSYHDHRIAMAACSAAFISSGNVTIKNAECVSKSYPDFYNEFSRKGLIICHRSTEQI